MPIVLTNFNVQTEWKGCTWSVPSVDDLANAIAIVAVGQALHVANILHTSGLSAKPTTKGAKAGAVKLLSGSVAHRDGWMFQVMSWLAANIQTPGGLMNVPQMIHADKGLDGLQVAADGAGKITALVLFEDKATDNPRATIKKDVWPEFIDFKSGLNEHQITAAVAQLLKGSGHPDPQQAVAEIMWETARGYRVSITDTASTDLSQSKLFKGYEKTVGGSLDQRRAEVFEVPNLRNWMEVLAQDAIAKVKALAVAV